MDLYAAFGYNGKIIQKDKYWEVDKMITLDLMGKVEETYLPTTRCLQPLFEAIANAIQATWEMPEKQGEVNITVIRDVPPELLGLVEQEAMMRNQPIESFIIEDNGIGFNDDNLKSFNTAHSRFKKKYGGKGVGRFLWLKAFDNVRIESLYELKGEKYKREFDFLLSSDGITNKVEEQIDNKAETGTKVYLNGFKSEYKEACNKKLETICKRIIEHFFVLFLMDSCPRMTITDNLDFFDLNFEFNNMLDSEAIPAKLNIKGQEFTLLHYKVNPSVVEDHSIHYIANDRVVVSNSIDGIVPGLTKAKINGIGDEGFFRYGGCLSGEYLDKHTNDARTSLDIDEVPGEENLYAQQIITKQDIKEAVINSIQDYLTPYLSTVYQDNLQIITEYIQTKNPKYRSLLKYCHEELQGIPVKKMSDDALERRLFEVHQKYLATIRNNEKKLLERAQSKNMFTKEYQRIFDDCLEKITELGRDSLSEYVSHRTAILELFNNATGFSSGDKYNLEKSIHNIVFPMNTTSDEIEYDSHNLWLIDERLAYHRYLASDKPLNKVLPEAIDVKTESEDKPDIIGFYDSLMAYSDDIERPCYSVVIIDFKRPGRRNYPKDDEPIDQLLRYMDRINEGKCKDRNGKQIKSAQSNNLLYYAYVICEITPEIARNAKHNQMKPTPDQDGFYCFHDEYNAYIEIISYNKLLRDAKKRNQIFMDKLFRPNTSGDTSSVYWISDNKARG